MSRCAVVVAAMWAAGILVGCSSTGDDSACNFGTGICGGETGGGGVVDSPGAPNFVKFSDNLSPVKISGIGKETTYSGNSDRVTSVAQFGATAPSSVTLTGNAVPTKLTVNGPTTTATWDSASNSTIKVLTGPRDEGNWGLVNDNGQNIAIIADPYAQDFEYQTFGAWQTGRDTRAGTIGAVSVGASTAPANIPVTDSATFEGTARGVYIDGQGESYTVNSDATLTADFARRTVNFGTSESRRVTSFDVARTPEPGLDLTGRMSYAKGSNAMTGTVSSANGMSGTIDGRFYGPVAEEIGGVFGVKRPTGTEAYTGGFGATRQPE